MQVVLLADVQNGYASQWIRIANTQGVEDIHIGDCFREQGFGKGAEELKVAGVDISPIGGFSKLFVDRGGNATQPEVHRLGCVFEMVAIAPPVHEPGLHDSDTDRLLRRPAGEGVVTMDVPANSIREQAAGRGRGRPPGSKNKPKPELVEMPAGFE